MMLVRYEPWGAWIKLDDALVGLERDGVRALGLARDAAPPNAWTDPAPPPSAPIEVHVAVTSRCAAGCEGCYLDARPDGVEPPRAEIESRFDALARAGVFTVAFGGGEPTLREDVGDLADAARARGLTPVVTTSGLGVSGKKLDRLARFAQVNVSYDGASEVYESVRGFDGSAGAERAIQKLAARGVKVGVNVVLTRASYGSVLETLRRAFELGAREAQLLRYKPAGRAASPASKASLDYLSRRLSPAQASGLGALLRTLSSALPEMRIRIDCALVPFLSADEEIASRPSEVARWGVLGCEAGAALAATRVDGKVLPCSFAGASTIDASDLASAAWSDEPLLRAFRAFPDRPSEPCASCTLRTVCRGGCKIVSGYVDGAIGADPECPRVIAHRGRER